MGGRSFYNGSRTKGQTISKAYYGYTEDAQGCEFRSFFGRIEDIINCFRDLLTFSKVKSVQLKLW